MPKTPRRDAKEEALQKHGALHPRPEVVTDQKFLEDEFFDRRDVVQVRYEMVRRVTVEKAKVSDTAKAFGFSRLTFYNAKEALECEGLFGLVPKKRGPKGGHKLKGKVLTAVLKARNRDPAPSVLELSEMVLKRFGLRVHPRSIRRALKAQEKKRR